VTTSRAAACRTPMTPRPITELWPSCTVHVVRLKSFTVQKIFKPKSWRAERTGQSRQRSALPGRPKSLAELERWELTSFRAPHRMSSIWRSRRTRRPSSKVEKLHPLLRPDPSPITVPRNGISTAVGTSSGLGTGIGGAAFNMPWRSTTSALRHNRHAGRLPNGAVRPVLLSSTVALFRCP
jgi:hypothetical protein